MQISVPKALISQLITTISFILRGHLGWQSCLYDIFSGDIP